jgi:hypothetical protein
MKHKFIGSQVGGFHNFKEPLEKCLWCKGLIKDSVRWETTRYGKYNTIEVPYCSPKCFHEDVNYSKEYFEKVVNDFFTSGGIERHLELKKIQEKQDEVDRKEWEIKNQEKEQQQQKEREEFNNKWRSRKRIFLLIFYSMLILGLMKQLKLI